MIVELAPEKQCIVCGKKLPTGGCYLAGSTPLGAIACEGRCLSEALRRHAMTGRVDARALS